MINSIPVVGWFLSLLFSVSLAVPFWICWTVCEIGEKYFYFLPEVYRHIDFWPLVGLFITISILKSVLSPKLVSINNNSSNND